MYLKKSFVSFLKAKNIFLLILGIFILSVSFSGIVKQIVFYSWDLNLIIHDSYSFVSVIFLFIGIFAIVCSRISRKLVNDACFFSEYFDADLNGYVDFEELAQLTGKTADQIEKQLALLRILYMKNFRVIQTINYQYPRVIELYSKTVTCSCQNCGCLMEKRIYFTGVCPYCKSSDLTAKVVSEQRFYYISCSTAGKPNIPSYYEAPGLESTRISYAVCFGIALFFWLIMFIVFMTSVNNYNNEDYFMEIFGKDSFSFEEIQSGVMNVIIFTSFGLIAIGSALVLTAARMMDIETAQRYARYFAGFPKPFITLTELHRISIANSPFADSSSFRPENIYKKILKTIKCGYLRSCSPEKHDGTLRIALAKQIVKDRCPYCGAPIVGAVTENYSCQYCRRMITDVIMKR